jgi:glucose/arabinose dehydrogenase
MPRFYSNPRHWKRVEELAVTGVQEDDDARERHMTQLTKRLFVTLAVLFSGLATTAQSAPLAQAVLIGTFDSPTYIATAPGQNELLFVVEQTGAIRVLQNEVLLPKPFLDISSRISCCGERGVLSMAFAPDYAASGLFYVAYTNTTGDVEIDEFKRKGLTALSVKALPGSRRHLLSVRHRDAGNHNGGQLQFGPDGFLYISIGDGGEVFPRGEGSRSLNSLLGKILRINPTAGGGKHYQIPADNPFQGVNQRPEIYAYGFRNPWRFSFDGQRIAIGDVGQSAEEEVDFLRNADARGVNFGWPQYEGKVVFDDTRPGPTPAKFPMLVYTHDNGGCAVIGGFVSHDPAIPALDGHYLYGDLCTGVIHAILPHVPAQKYSAKRAIGITAPNLTTFGLGPNSALYFAQTSGEVSRIAPP